MAVIFIRNSETIEIQFNITLDATKKRSYRRIYFKQDEGTTTKSQLMVLYKGRRWKYLFTVYIHNSLHTSTTQDKITPIKIGIVHNLVPSSVGKEGVMNDNRLIPILWDEGVKTEDISFKNDCGEDRLCTPDLSVKYYVISGDYVPGSNDDIAIRTIVNNNGEDAFNAKLFLQIPHGIKFSKAESSNTAKPLLCDFHKNNNLVCDIIIFLFL